MITKKWQMKALDTAKGTRRRCALEECLRDASGFLFKQHLHVRQLLLGITT